MALGRNIRAELDNVDPFHNQLVSQTSCPEFEIFWMQRTAVAALQAKELVQQEGKWPVKHDTKEKKHLKGTLFCSPISDFEHYYKYIYRLIDRVSYERPQFEEQHLTLVDFTPEFINVNRKRTKPIWNGIGISR